MSGLLPSDSRIRAYHELYVGLDAGRAGIAFWDAARRYVAARRQTLLDVAMEACAAHVQLDEDLEDLNPLLQKAIRDTNPRIDDDRWFSLGEDARLGAINAAKGKYFEYLVADRLNNGQQVGDLVLAPGQHAELAASMTQPGWDMRIVDANGDTVEYLQLKATNSIGYIHQTMERYPDIQILATSEVAGDVRDGQVILDGGMSDADLNSQLEGAIDVADTSVTERFVDYASPILPLVLMAGMEGYRVAIGQASLGQFKQAMINRGKRLIVLKISGATVYALGGGMLALPAALAGGLMYDRLRNVASLGEAYAYRVDRLAELAQYRHQHLVGGAR